MVEMDEQCPGRLSRLALVKWVMWVIAGCRIVCSVKGIPREVLLKDASQARLPRAAQASLKGTTQKERLTLVEVPGLLLRKRTYHGTSNN